jgi:hypothetical protein
MRTARDWCWLGRSSLGPALGGFGREGWRCFRRATGPGVAELRRLHVNARAEAISGCQELLRAAAGPNLWLRAILGSTPSPRPWTPTPANGALLSQTTRLNPPMNVCVWSGTHRSRSGPSRGGIALILRSLPRFEETPGRVARQGHLR